MKIIVGLGNPGEKYQKTRHNVGFMYLDFLTDLFRKEDVAISWETKSRFKAQIAEFQYKGKKMAFVKPLTYMNESGWSVSQYLSWNKGNPGNIVLVHDDLDIQLGKYKFSPEKSPKIHFGVISVENYLHTKSFTRLRIGVDNRQEGNRIQGVNYVMGRFSDEEERQLLDVFHQTLAPLNQILLPAIKQKNTSKS